MKLHFLGTGTSTGIPVIGCDCDVCTSADPHDRRLRTSALVETDAGTRILIDCGPDFREQMLHQTFAPIDALLVTHEHYDHVGGIDDLRPFCVFGQVDIYGEDQPLQHLRERMPYCFKEHKYPGVPNIALHNISPATPFLIKEQEVVPLRVMHGALPILGFRIGSLAYITDMKTFPDEELPKLQGIRTLVVNGLRFTPHGSHQTIPDAIHFARLVKAERTYLVHLCHQAGRHAALEKQLPADVRVAYDGLTIDC